MFQAPIGSYQPQPLQGRGRPGMWESGLVHGQYDQMPLPPGLWYKSGKTYSEIVGPLPALIKDNYIIGRYNHGYLLPIYDNIRQMVMINIHNHNDIVVIHGKTARQLNVMRPITPQNTSNYYQTQPSDPYEITQMND